MKKRILLLLAAVLCVCLCACGGSVKTQQLENAEEQLLSQLEEEQSRNDTNIWSEQIEEQEIRIEQEDDILVVYLSKKQLSDCLKKVTLTKENWFEYFGDYDIVKHRVETNSFGDVEEEVDDVYKGFGLKNDIFAVYQHVAFKFSGMTVVGYDGAKHIYEIGKDSYKSYDENGEFIGETKCENREYYYVELNHPGLDKNAGNCWYEGHECIDVIGEIIILDLQFNEQSEEQNYTDIELRFTDTKEVVSLSSIRCFDILESYID